MDIYAEIGKKIREARKNSGLTQEVLAEASNISAHFLSTIETGKEKPSLETLYRISEALKIPLWKIMQFESKAETRGRSSYRMDAMLKAAGKNKQEFLEETMMNIYSNMKKYMK
jgi:transcriptional regulator with XRE-family HTH domain